MPNFAKGTIGVCIIAHPEGATTIIGGGDSATAAISLGYAEKFSHISTGGELSEYLEGKYYQELIHYQINTFKTQGE